MNLLKDRVLDGYIKEEGNKYKFTLKKRGKHFWHGCSTTKSMAKITAEAYIKDRKMNEVIVWHD